jgi:hypothetical protein
LREIVPLRACPGFELPELIPAAFKSRKLAGGDEKLHSKLLSVKAVSLTGTGTFCFISAVLALNSLQKESIFRPCPPKAGPTGGDGFAQPASITKDIVARTLRDINIDSLPTIVAENNFEGSCDAQERPRNWQNVPPRCLDSILFSGAKTVNVNLTRTSTSQPGGATRTLVVWSSTVCFQIL